MGLSMGLSMAAIIVRVASSLALLVMIMNLVVV